MSNLIECPDCGQDVSIRAAACPGCGAPVSMSGDSLHVTTQSTGKSLKLQGALSVLLFLAGAVTILAQPAGTEPRPAGPLLLVIGVVWWIVVRIQKWWRHA